MMQGFEPGSFGLEYFCLEIFRKISENILEIFQKYFYSPSAYRTLFGVAESVAATTCVHFSPYGRTGARKGGGERTQVVAAV
jgi:hypothetical protein